MKKILIFVVCIVAILFFINNSNTFFKSSHSKKSEIIQNNNSKINQSYAILMPKQELEKALKSLFSSNINNKEAEKLCKKILTIVKNYNFNEKSAQILKDKLIPSLKLRFKDNKEILKIINKIEKNIKVKKIDFA